MEEGSSWKTFDPVLAIKKCSIDKSRHATEEIGSRSIILKSRNSPEVNVKSLCNDDIYDGEESTSENRNEEGYLFSSDSE